MNNLRGNPRTQENLSDFKLLSRKLILVRPWTSLKTKNRKIHSSFLTLVKHNKIHGFLGSRAINNSVYVVLGSETRVVTMRFDFHLSFHTTISWSNFDPQSTGFRMSTSFFLRIVPVLFANAERFFSGFDFWVAMILAFLLAFYVRSCGYWKYRLDITIAAASCMYFVTV